MLRVLANTIYRSLFLAQVIALVGTGLATVALGLLAYDLAGANAGAVLGTALAIKMIAYVGVSPIAAAFAERLPRRAMLVGLDLVRAAVAVLLPFVSEVWQVYVLIFVLQAASAGFTPTFQATIPDVLPDENEYTRALSLSRLAYDLESLVSPMLAAALLTVMSFHSLFAGTVLGFLASAAFVISTKLPSPKPAARRGIYDRTTRGIRIYLATPRLRGLSGDQHGSRCSWRDGDRQHCRAGSVAIWTELTRHSACTRGVRGRLNGCGTRLAKPARQDLRIVTRCSLVLPYWSRAYSSVSLSRVTGCFFPCGSPWASVTRWRRRHLAGFYAVPRILRIVRPCSLRNWRCLMPAGYSRILSPAGLAARLGCQLRVPVSER